MWRSPLRECSCWAALYLGPSLTSHTLTVSSKLAEAYQVDAELNQALFPDGEGRPPRLESKRDQSWVLNQLGITYSMLGRECAAHRVVKSPGICC